MIYIVLASALALTLLGASFFLIYRFDFTRRWDHIARSLLQIAIATVTVTVALALFERQIADQNMRTTRQQALVASGILRSIALSLGDDARSVPRLFEVSASSECREVANCKMSDVAQRYYNFQREILSRASQDRSEELMMARAATASETRQSLLRNYVIPEASLRRLLNETDAYERGLRQLNPRVELIASKFQDEVSKIAEGGPSPQVVADLFLQLATIQADSARIARTYACRLHKMDEELKGNLQLSESDVDIIFTLSIAEGISCPPYDEAFEQMANWDGKHVTFSWQQP